MLLGLVACNVMWSAGYSISKALMTAGFKPLEVAFLRYATGAIPLLILSLRGGRKSELVRWARSIGPVDTRLLIVGVLTFFVSPFCQMTGLKLSRAVDGSLMIALEPLVTIIGACLILGERLLVNQLIGIVLALVGVGILTELTWSKATAFTDERMIGNIIFLISLLSEMAYSTVAKPVLARRPPLIFTTVSLLVGVALLFAYNIATEGPARLAGLTPLIAHASLKEWAGVAFLGFGCTAFGYLFWMKVLEHAPVSIMAVTLYIQPVLGMVWGSVWLGESLTLSTFVGAALILGAVWLATRPTRRVHA